MRKGSCGKEKLKANRSARERDLSSSESDGEPMENKSDGESGRGFDRIPSSDSNSASQRPRSKEPAQVKVNTKLIENSLPSS